MSIAIESSAAEAGVRNNPRAAVVCCACRVCGYETAAPAPCDLGAARGNTARFIHTYFRLWKCPRCQTIRALEELDHRAMYEEYPLRKLRLDALTRGTLGNLLKRLRQAGLQRTDTILDYGCGNGLFVEFLKARGYTNVSGYDPYVPEFAAPPAPHSRYDCVVANDVLEHCEDPRAFLRACAAPLKPGGLLYIGTSDSEGVEMHALEPHLMRLHLPFHRTILNQERLYALVQELGLQRVRAWRRSYMDTWRPFANYRFLDEFNKVFEHNLDRALNSATPWIILGNPRVFFYAFFGYFFPTAYEPAVAVRKSDGAKNG